MISQKKQTKVFADTAEIKEIYNLLQNNVPIEGVTTNPTLLAKAFGDRKFTEQDLDKAYMDLLKEIRKILPDGSISGEIFVKPETKSEEIYKMASEMSDQVDRIHIKIPIFGEGLKAAGDFVKKGGRVNMTLCFSLDQARAVEEATMGATEEGQVYVSPFVGRLEKLGERGMSLIENIYTKFAIDKAHTKILAASIRNLEQLENCIAMGIDLVTVPPAILNEWKEKGFRRLKNIPYIDNKDLNIDHQLTTEGFEAFVEARQSLLK